MKLTIMLLARVVLSLLVSSGAMTPAHGVDLAVDDILAPTATRHLSDKSFKDFPIRQDLLQGIPFDRCTEGQHNHNPSTELVE